MLNGTFNLAILLVLAAQADEVVVREGVITNVPAHPRLYVPTPEALASSAANEERFSPLIESTAQRYGLETALVRAVVKVESAFYPKAYSKAGAVGLMQLMPATARELGVSDPWDPSANVDGGCRYLRMMLERFGGDLRLALAAYNAGPGAVEHYSGIPPYPETQRYVSLVLEGYRRYGGEAEGTVEFTDVTPSAPVYVAPDGTITNVPPTP